MKRIIIFAAIALLASCAKPAEYNQTLGLFSINTVLSSAGGSTEVPVFSNTSWTVKFQEPVKWASTDRLCGSGCGYIMFSYETNFGRSRRVVLEFVADRDTMTQAMFQQAGIANSDVHLDIEDSSYDVPSAGIDTVFAFSTNLIYNLDELYLDITYPEGQESALPWVTMERVTADSLWLNFAPIDSVGTRIANVRVAHTDAGAEYDSEEGTTLTSNALSVTQTKEAE